MAAKRYTPEKIIGKLQDTEVLQGQGETVTQAVKNAGD